MEIKYTILTIMTVVNLALGFLVYSRNAKNPINKTFLIFGLSLAMWSYGMMRYSGEPFNKPEMLLWSKVLYAAGSMVATSLFAFSLTYTKKLKLIHSILLLSVNCLMFYLIFIGQNVIINIENNPGNRVLVHGDAYWLYFIHFFVFVFSATSLLFVSYLKARGSKRATIGLITLGFLIPGLISSVINMILPAFSNFQIAWTGPIFLFIMLGFIGYAITKHGLFDFKIIATQLFLLLLIFIILVWAIASGQIFPYIILAGTITSGYLIIKSTEKEIRQREELELLAEKLEEANVHLKDLDRMKDDFLSMASHELNTPLAAIEGYLSMILEEGMAGGNNLNPQTREYLSRVFKASGRLSDIVKDLLNVSRIESGRIHLIYAEGQIEQIIKDAVNEIDPKIKEKNHIVCMELPMEPLPKSWMDITRVSEIVINLLGNAIKYTDNGGHIEIGAKEEGGNILVWVKDNGKGIPKDKSERVFQKFTQVDVLKDEVKGTGLGMYISQKFVELHKGKIWFESEGEGKGTVFYFSLPIVEKKPYDPNEGDGPVLR